MSRRLADALLSSGSITPEELARAEDYCARHNVGFAQALVDSGAVAEELLSSACAEVHDLPSLALDEMPAMSVYDELPLRFMRQSHVLPVRNGATLRVAIADPGDDLARRSVELICGQKVEWCVATFSQIRRGLENIYEKHEDQLADIVDQIVQDGDGAEESEDQLRHLAAEAPIVRLVNLLIHRAVEMRASDIHIEPFDRKLRVRYRVDGVLQEVQSPPAHSTAAVVSRIKLMARLNIAERRLPQDGRTQLRLDGRQIDMRVSTVPTLHGESVVLRLLDRDNAVLDFARLGFEGEVLEKVHAAISQAHGMALVSGPTGSGKTTTLYAALAMLNDGNRKIISVEDPVEYQLDGVNQIQVQPAIGLDFADALRSIVRQDPDIIMIGEMRDTDTARIATQSALTGHLVFSTVHTNNAAGTVTRLLDMGLEPYLLTSTLNVVIAQRLLRTLCTECRRPAEPEALDSPGDGDWHAAAGCPKCSHTGYSGRCMIMEVMTLTPELRGAIAGGADQDSLQQAAIDGGMQTIWHNGLARARSGVTSIDEVLRVTGSD